MRKIINNIAHFENYLHFGDDRVYILLAMQRGKDNNGEGNVKASRERKYPKYVKRRIITNLEDYRNFTDELQEFGKKEWKNYRLYITHNPRSLKKGYAILHTELFSLLNQNEAEYVNKLQNLDMWFRTYLHRPISKAKTIYHMLDIDSLEYPDFSKKIEVICTFRTPNGFHSLCKPFNPSLLKGVKNVTFNQDSMINIYSDFIKLN